MEARMEIRQSIDSCSPPMLSGGERGEGPEDPCDLVTVPARQGLEAVDILRRGAAAEAVGPVLHDDNCDTLGFLVPPGTASAWDVPGSTCTATDGRGCGWRPSRLSRGRTGCCRRGRRTSRRILRCCGRRWGRRLG